jgi:hypothetical protein
MAIVSEELFTDERLANVRVRVRPLRRRSRRPRNGYTVRRKLDRGIRRHPDVHMRQPADSAQKNAMRSLLGELDVRTGEGGVIREGTRVGFHLTLKNW